MKLPRLFSSWICITFGFVEIQALVFDILRNSSALKTQDTCAILRCQAGADYRDANDIHQIISLVIFEKDINEKFRKPLASLSFFDAGSPALGDDPTRVNAIGELLSKEGSLTVHLKDSHTSCLSGIFICELQYVNDKQKGKVTTAEKRLYQPAKQSETSNQATDELKNLQTLITDEVSKLSEKTENVTANIVSIVTSMNDRLLRIESMMEGELQSQLSNLNLKLNKLEALLSNSVEAKLTSLTETVGDSTDVIKSYVTDGFLATQRQMNIVGASITERIANTESWMNESLRTSMTSHAGCDNLQTNVSSMFHLALDNISSFKTDVMGRLSAISNIEESYSNMFSTRLIIESLARIVHNISTFDSKLIKLKSDFGTEMKTVRRGITSLNDNMTSRHFRFTREVKRNISDLESLVTEKFRMLENQKQSLTSLDQEMKGKLVNIEINLNDINIVMRSIKRVLRYLQIDID